MARRNANLAGLAALGALGYKLANAGTKKPTASGAVAAAPAAASIDRAVYDDDINPDVVMGSSRDLGDELGTRQNLETGEYYSTMMAPKRLQSAKPQGAKKPYSMTSDTVDPNVKKMVDTGDETGRLAKRYPKPEAKVAPRKLSYEERLAQIPGSAPEGWAGGSGERVTGNETTRNLNNIMNATAGVSVPGYVGKMTQAGYNARAAARRAAGELTPAEIEAAKEAAQAARDAKTLNPNAWMAGPKGMMENFKKGGAVKAKAKKMVVTKTGGKVSSASKRADGIAQKGKTRGKLY